MNKVLYSVSMIDNDQIYQLPSNTFRIGVHIDLIDHLLTSNGNRYLMTYVDRCTKWPEAWLFVNMLAHTVTCTLINQWFSRFYIYRSRLIIRGRYFQHAINSTQHIAHSHFALPSTSERYS